LTKTLIIILAFLVVPFLAFGANYYVDCGAGSDGSGTYASPWNVYTSHIANDLSNGDGVYFKVGVTCTLNGSTRDHIYIVNSSVTIGCYDGDGSFDCSSIDIDTGANMPKFDGGDSYPGEPFLRIRQPNVTVQDIWVTKMNHGGILADGNSYSGDSATIQRCRVDDLYRQGIYGSNSDNSLFTYNVVTDVNQIRATNCTDLGGAAMTCDNGCESTTLSYNKVFNNAGEGIGGYGNRNTGSPNIIEFNEVHNNRSAGIHSTDSVTTIRYNIVGAYDTGGDGYESAWYGGTYPNCTESSYSGGIAVGGTTTYAAFANVYKIYGNLSSGNWNDLGSFSPVGIGCSIGSASRTQGDTLECIIYNNTSVDNEVNYRMNKAGSAMGVESYAKNNISVFYDTSGSLGTESDPNNESTWDYNLWESAPAASVQGANDPAYADADLTTQSGYAWPASRTAIDFDDIVPRSASSPPVDAGDTLGAPYDSDYFATSRPQGIAYDIGAVESASNPIRGITVD
jgi:hypothetical protein